MKNKTWTCLVVVSAALLMAGCGSRTKKQTNEDVSMDSVGVTCSGVKTLQLEGVQATWIQDNAGEHLMPRTIFPDASDELMESWGRKINCVMRRFFPSSSVGDRPAPRGCTSTPDERKVTTI